MAGRPTHPAWLKTIYSELEDLVVDRSDDVADLLRGKTFARALH